MAISVLLLITCAVVLVFMVPHSKYGLPMFFMICGIILSTISVLCQYYSSSSYIPPSYLPFRGFDIFLYRFAGRNIRLPMHYLQMLRSAGVVTYLLGISMLIDSIRRNLKQGSANASIKAFVISKGCFLFLTAFYILFYSTGTAYSLYLKYQSLTPAGQKRLFYFISVLHSLFNLVVLIYMFYPLVFFLINVIRKKVTCFTNTIIMIVLSVSSINVCFYYFVFTGIFRNSAQHVFKTGFWFFNRITRIPPAYISLYPIFALIILIFIILSINGFFALDLLSYSRNRLLKKQIDDLNYNLKDVFHSEKNLMFSMNILANEALASYGTDEGKQKLERILDISSEQMRALSESLNSIKQLHIKPGAVDLKVMTDNALKQVGMPKDVTVEKCYCNFPVLCTLDQYHTMHAISNLIINSLDSLAMSKSEDKKIVVTIDASSEWVYWSLWDNGLGIEPRSVRKMMMPFASTKSKQSNWGIGLPYAFRVITTQLGQMKITGSTRENDHHAFVEILLPRRKPDNGKN